PKYDALAAYSFTDFSDKLFVDLAFVRAASSGATFLGFELNQKQPGYRLDPNESDASNPFAVPTRSRGDLLVTYNVSTQGAIALGLCIWDGNEHSGRWEVFAQDLSGAPITNQTCPAISSTLYQAALNDAQDGRQGDIPAAENQVGTGIIGEGRFGEAVVNLTDALKDPSNQNGPQPCIDFGYVWLHSRSSDSLNSNQQDFVLPAKPVSIGNCSVEGKKFSDSNGDGDNDGAANGEPFLGGWTMFVDYDGDGVLDNNKDSNVVNDMDGVIEAGEEEPYDVTSDGTDGNPLGHYRITDVQSSAAAPGGTWQVREVSKAAWECTAAIGAGAVATCPERTDTDPGTALGFQLAWTNNEAHTGRDFGNRRQPATLKVVKHVVTDNGGTATAANWSLHVSSGATEVSGSPKSGAETGDVYTLADGGSYTVSETGGPSGYAASFSGDCDANGSVTLAAGTQKTCTITNDDIAPTITVVKHVVNKGGSTATAADFQMDVTATDAGDPHFSGTEQGKTITLDAGRYSVDESGGPSTFAKELSEGCAGTIAVGAERTCTITNTKVLPGGIVVKKGASYAYHGDTLNFTFEVTNPGTTPLTTITVTDDKCAPVLGPTQKLGGNQDGQLDAGELWVYTCTMTVPEHVAGDTGLVNVVTLAATDADGEPVTDTDSHTTRILHPAIAIDKTGPGTAQAGDPVVYGLVVTNPGDVPFLAPNVSVTDPLCEAPPLLTSKNGDSTPDRLDPGDSWSYTCRVQTLAGQTKVDNVGSVTAKDSFGGREVSGSDPATTALTQPPAPAPAPPATLPLLQSGVAAERISSPAAGTARLTGPARCVDGPFTVKVTGRGIAQVVYTLDGKRIKTVKSAAGRTVFSVRINPKGQNAKAHRVSARVTFNSATGTKARTLRYVYLGCRSAVLPQFTG
ncbi:MAG TPA: hypothetical protein VMY78_11210, partial [Solirubrobacteraceae bacterium]|nr:hypothetical protein [Solirubrobacteraceae bacterium]